MAKGFSKQLDSDRQLKPCTAPRCGGFTLASESVSRGVQKHHRTLRIGGDGGGV